MHQMVDVNNDGIPDDSPDDPFDTTKGLMEPLIKAMAYPKDACNYTWTDTNQPVFENDNGPLLAGAGGCLFKVPVPPVGGRAL